MGVEFFLNLIVILLLIPTIVFAVILNRRLEILRNSRNDLGRLIDAFNEATTRAESGIPRLKQAADSTSGVLREQMQKAQTLRDDLAFMIERAEATAEKMENRLSSRFVSDEKKASPVFVESEKDIAVSQRTGMKKRDGKTKKRPLVESEEDLISSAVSAAEDILRQTERAASVKASAKTQNVPLTDEAERSEAERELLKALRVMR